MLMNDVIRMGVFIHQLEAGRSADIAAMVVEASMPYGHLDDNWPGHFRRKVKKLSREVAKSANPKCGWSEQELLKLLQDTFGEYMAIAAAMAGQASIPFRSWRAYSRWSFNPQLNIKDLLEREGLRSESEVLT
jgi:hypothetical protein